MAGFEVTTNGRIWVTTEAVFSPREIHHCRMNRTDLRCNAITGPRAMLLLLLVSIAFGADKANTLKQSPLPTADTELKLREIYNEHANASERGGQKLSALAERNCADLHATAAELILANPAKARAISKSVKESCDDLLKHARDNEQALAEDRLRASCKKLSLELTLAISKKAQPSSPQWPVKLSGKHP